MSNKNLSVELQLDQANHDLVLSNRSKLIPIVSTIVFCGTHDLSLRGRKSNEGNFQDLLQFRVEAGDKILQEHLSSCSGKTKYTSHRTQNTLINICGSLIQNEIVNSINSDQTVAFSLLADETADISGIEQLSIGVRFVSTGVGDDKKLSIREEFLGFTKLKRMDAKTLSDEIISFCNNLKLDMTKLYGLGFDGCSAMAGHESGVQKRIRDAYPKALYFHCASHRLNLTVNDLNEVPEIRNTIGTIKEVIKFFRESTLRRDLVPNLPLLSETRWTEKYKSIRFFSKNFKEINTALDSLTTDPNFNSVTRVKAQQLSSATSGSCFLVCRYIIDKYSALLEPVTNILQSKSIDMYSVKKHIKTLITLFNEHRQSDEIFLQIFGKAEKVANDLDIEIKLPRITKHQINRSNVATSSIREYYKISIYLRYIDSLISSLNTRFSDDNNPAYFLYILHPYNINKISNDDYQKSISEIEKHYDLDNFIPQAESWWFFWRTNKEHNVNENTDMIELLEHCQFYPAVKKAIQISVCLAPTTCTI
nr:unnamed protein product [Callosobruchus chinensis]